MDAYADAYTDALKTHFTQNFSAALLTFMPCHELHAAIAPFIRGSMSVRLPWNDLKGMVWKSESSDG